MQFKSCILLTTSKKKKIMKIKRINEMISDIDNPNVWMKKSREIAEKLNLCTSGSDSYGNFREQFHKYEIVSKWMDAEFPSFSVEEYEYEKYPVGHINWYKRKRIKNGKFKIIVEIHGYNGRLRFWAGVSGTNDKRGYIYRYGDIDLNNLLDDYSIKPDVKSEEDMLWDKIENEYFKYVDSTNGENNFDDYFKYMKNLVKKTFKI